MKDMDKVHLQILLPALEAIEKAIRPTVIASHKLMADELLDDDDKAALILWRAAMGQYQSVIRQISEEFKDELADRITYTMTKWAEQRQKDQDRAEKN